MVSHRFSKDYKLIYKKFKYRSYGHTDNISQKIVDSKKFIKGIQSTQIDKKVDRCSEYVILVQSSKEISESEVYSVVPGEEIVPREVM